MQHSKYLYVGHKSCEPQSCPSPKRTLEDKLSWLSSQIHTNQLIRKSLFVQPQPVSNCTQNYISKSSCVSCCCSGVAYQSLTQQILKKKNKKPEPTKVQEKPKQKQQTVPTQTTDIVRVEQKSQPSPPKVEPQGKKLPQPIPRPQIKQQVPKAPVIPQINKQPPKQQKRPKIAPVQQIQQTIFPTVVHKPIITYVAPAQVPKPAPQIRPVQVVQPRPQPQFNPSPLIPIRVSSLSPQRPLKIYQPIRVPQRPPSPPFVQYRSSQHYWNGWKDYKAPQPQSKYKIIVVKEQRGQQLVTIFGQRLQSNQTVRTIQCQQQLNFKLNQYVSRLNLKGYYSPPKVQYVEQQRNAFHNQGAHTYRNKEAYGQTGYGYRIRAEQAVAQPRIVIYFPGQQDGVVYKREDLGTTRTGPGTWPVAQEQRFRDQKR